jgi:hypothetical protein
VEKYIEQSDLSNGRKQIGQQAYADWCRYKKFEYETPRAMENADCTAS